jgi:DNA-binding response OmpR family regulator
MGSRTGSEIDDVLGIINERQQISYNELGDIAFNRGISEENLRASLLELEKTQLIASRSSGGVMMYYPLQQQNLLRKVLIVEDDKNINKLMALSIGKEFEINQLYDGGEAISFIRSNKPDLVILDLMLPNKDGLDICQTIKSGPDTSGTTVIIVSAMDPTSNRFKGIKYGADYYIKKPFDPKELRSLVTIFLKKRGKKFDPLIDLPDEERISKEVERSIKSGSEYIIGTLKIEHLGDYAKRFGGKSAVVILRLVSQLLQDIIAKDRGERAFVGFLNGDVFVLAGPKGRVGAAVEEVTQEFGAVLPFILQDEGYKFIDLDLDSLFESNEVPRLSLSFEQVEKEKIAERRDEILKSKGGPTKDLGSYTYEELRRLFGSDGLDITITRDTGGVKLQVGKSGADEKE